MAPPLLTLDTISLTFGGDPLFSGVSLSISPRERIALVGRNGSGKSTLMKIIANMTEADGGRRYVDPGATVLYLPQEPDLSGFKKVIDYLTAPRLNNSGEETGEEIPAYAYASYLETLNIQEDQDIAGLSGGEARRVAIMRALVENPDILLLDEPTNHLDIAAIEWLENTLRSLQSALVLISHDRQFLSNLTNKTVWLDRGIAHSRNAGFEGFEDWRDKILTEEEAEHHKLGRKIVAEEHWVRYGVTARRKRNVRRMGELQQLRQKFSSTRKAPQNVSFSLAQSGKSGKTIIEAKSVSKSYGSLNIVDDFSLRITRGERIGLVGENGAGKTTLLQLLIGELTPDTGTVKVGESVNLVSLDQRRATLTPGMRVADAITDGRGDFVTIGDTKRHVASYLKDFLFAPEQWRSPVEALSGGERGRLALAAALAKPSNLLVLDEPTNDLDIETLDLLQDILSTYEGTLLLVSHDRSFLDRTVTSVIAKAPQSPTDKSKGDKNKGDRNKTGALTGKWLTYAGGYSDMLVQQKEAQTNIQDPTQNSVSGKLVPDKEKQSPTKATKNQGAKSSPSNKLSYKEKFALETLPKTIATLEQTIITCKETLAIPNLFQTDHKKFNDAATTLEKAEADLFEAEEQWLELEMKKEDLGS